MLIKQTSKIVTDYYLKHQQSGVRKSLNGESSPLKFNSEEVKKYFAFNETGNVMVATTQKNLLETKTQLIQTFQKCIILYGAISKALINDGNKLTDYSGLKKLISNSSKFSLIKSDKRIFKSKERSLQLSTEIIRQLFGPLSSNVNALRIVKELITSLGNDLRLTQKNSSNNREIGHLLFICEDLMGIPIVSLSLFRIIANESSDLLKVNCSSKISKEISFQYSQETFFFNDMDLINKYSNQFNLSEDYTKLVEEYRNSLAI